MWVSWSFPLFIYDGRSYALRFVLYSFSSVVAMPADREKDVLHLSSASPDPERPPSSLSADNASTSRATQHLALDEDQPLEFRRKDGSISRMRSHKGNIPVLPQTKLCPHCPAKFTRTTHLNRHMRNRMSDLRALRGFLPVLLLMPLCADTNDRSHQCEVSKWVSYSGAC